MDSVQKTINEYKQLLEDMSSQYAKTIAAAHKQMQELISSVENQARPVKPESVWIEKDGERYLLMNKQAVDQLNSMFDQFKVVIEELVKQERKEK